MSFTVLTVTKRTGWEETAIQSIWKQTLQPDRWIVITENELEEIPGAEVYKAPPKTQASNLNKSTNAGLKLIDTEYVIFYQDFIELPPDCFEKLIALATPTTFVTTCTPKYDGSDDGRYHGLDVPRTCWPEEWEANVGLAPMQMLRDIGGFWNELDKGWSWDNVDVAGRAAMIGADFIIDETNRPKLLNHEQTSKLTMTLNGDVCMKHLDDIRGGKMPIDVGCLK